MTKQAVSIRIPAGNLWAWVGMGLSLMVPSTGLVQKYLGLPGVGAYLLGAGCLLAIAARAPIQRRLDGLPRQRVWALLALTLAGLLAVVLVAYPIVDAWPGGGSDGDNALRLAGGELLHGRYPYYPRTHLDNPISPLPGAVLLALPFVLLGNVALQNLFWLALFTFALAAYWQDPRPALFLLWVALALSPAVMYALVAGYDYLANSLYVLLFSVAILRYVPRSEVRPAVKLVPAALLGIGLSSRANMLLVLPLLVAALARSAGWPIALRTLAITLATGVLVTAPFYLYDPAGFSPLHTVGELGRFGAVLPGAGLVVPALNGLLAVGLALGARAEPGDFLRRSALALAFPVAVGIVLASLATGHLDFGFALFGLFFLFFGAAGCLPIARPGYGPPTGPGSPSF
jgi:hypothetical protein